MIDVPIVKRLIAVVLSIGFLALSSTSGRTAGEPTVRVSITAVSGDAGHAFVFAQVSDSTLTYPAPTGTTHLSPYYSEWVRAPFATPSCPWIWAVYVFDRSTNAQVNLPPPNAPLPNFGTSTLVCASPTITPVDQPPVANASAELDLDLQVSMSPPVAVAGSPTVVSAVLSSALTQDLNLYLSMAIADWSVAGWSVEFGDGQGTHLNGGTATTIQVSHTYRSAGTYDGRVLASISGHAQAAVYDRYGSPRLIRRPFAVDIANHAMATARSQPARRYLPPHAAVAVSPSLGITAGDATAPAFRHIDALRGSMTTLVVHLLIIREGQLTLDGLPRGFGRSRLTGWRLDGSPSDAPPGSGTNPGRNHPPTDLLRLQWNTPDRINGTQPQDYAVPMTLYFETHFPDGHVGSYVIASSFSVSVGFAAQSG
jgi:hypothetical protein